MSLTTRRIITIVFIIGFCIIAPITLLYTSGFRYNWGKNKISEVGVLAIKTYPANARISLNNKPIKGSSPFYLNDLEPNIYTVRAEMPGYFPWQKSLEVKSRKSTLAYDVVLFKQSLPLLLAQGAINAFALDHGDNHCALVRNASTVDIIASSGTTSSTLYTAPQNNLRNVHVSWSANNSYLLVENFNDPNASLIIPTDGRRAAFTLRSRVGAAVSSPRFDANDDEALYGLTAEGLIRISLNVATTPTLLLGGVQSFEVTALGSFALVPSAEGVDLIQFSNYLLVSPLHKLTTLPRGKYIILPGSSLNFIAIANTTSQKVLLINTQDTTHPFIQLNGIIGKFGNGGRNQTFVALSDQEITLYDLASAHSTLLGRYSTAPSEAFPLYDIPYYLLHAGNQLHITELDDRDVRNTVTLTADSSLRDIIINQSGTRVFYITNTGLFALDIQ